MLLSIAAILGWASLGEAQAPKSARKGASEAAKAKDDEQAKKDDPKADDVKKDDAKGKKGDAKEGADAAEEKKGDKKEAEAEEPEAPKKEPAIEVFKDPRAEAILQKKFGTVGKLPNPNDKRAVLNMVAGAEGLDKAVLQRFVDGATYLMTYPANVAAMVEGGKRSKDALEIKRGTDDLLEALHKAQLAKNAAFLTDYNRILLASLPKLLDNNLFARIEAMIILGQTGNADVLPIAIKQLEDTNQTVWVKVWAARAITSAAAGGARELPPGLAGNAAKALAGWLEKEKELPWFAQVRALEALGALRMAKTPQAPATRLDFANVAMKFLADPEARPEVRAMAAWALGMVRIDNATNKYNFSLVAYNIAEVAAELGEKVNGVFDQNQNQSRYYTSFLLNQIHPSLEGVPGARDSGLLNVPQGHPAMAQARPFVKQVDELVKAVSVTSVNLLNAPRGKYKDMQKELNNRVSALRSFLQKNPPADAHLVPGGQAFPVAEKVPAVRAVK